jgi:hypothetical protein
MPNEPNKTKSMNATTPKIPGVPERPAPKPENSRQVAEENPPDGRRRSHLWIGGAAVLAIVIALVWWAHGASTPGNGLPALRSSRSAGQPSQAAQNAPIPVAPGPIANVADMKQDWSTKAFVYKEANGDKTPALLVRLPKGEYWAISLREPFGNCQMEFASVEKLRGDYNLSAPYPMIGDPCTHTVFDLTQYGEGPNGMVRGAVVTGAAVRPPLAIEVNVKGGKIIASQEEEAVKVQ